jgi:hypothetical protein
MTGKGTRTTPGRQNEARIVRQIRSTGKAELFINEIFVGLLLHMLRKWRTLFLEIVESSR